MRVFLFTSLILLAACQNAEVAASGSLATQKEGLKKLSADLKANGNAQSSAIIDQQIAALDEKDEKSYITLADSLIAAGKNDEAAKLLASTNFPDSDVIKLKLAKTYIDNGEELHAFKALETVKNKESKEYYNLLGISLDMQEKHEAAQEAYNKGLGIDSLDENLRNNMAMSKILTGDYAESILVLEELVKSPYTKQKNLPQYRQNLALAYGLSGKNDKAYKFLAKDLPQGQIQQNLGFYKAYRKNQVR